MGNKLRDEDLNLNIIVNGDKGKKELGDLEKSTRELTARNKELRAEKEKLERANEHESQQYKDLIAKKKAMELAGKQETEQYKELLAEKLKMERARKDESDQYRKVKDEIAANSKTLKTNESRMTELRKEIGLTGLSMRQLRSEQTRLKRLMDSSTPGTDSWKMYRAELDKVEGQIAKVKDGSQRMHFSMGKMADGFNRYFAMVSVWIASLTGVVLGFKKASGAYAEFDDQVADVQKTTGLTKDEVIGLDKSLQELDTRTAQEDLLDLAKVAGKLGVSMEEDVEGFVRGADKIAVALTEDLGGDIEESINDIGKLIEIFKLDEDFGIEASMMKVGSAINSLGASGTANEGYIVEFTKRLAGIAPSAGISIDKVMGLAAVLDQLGQTSEVSSTVFSQVIPDMFKDTATYAGIAKMGVSEFKDLLLKDANEAFLKFLEGLHGNNGGLAEMTAKLDGLGLEGKRSISVLGVLANNTDELRKQQAFSNQEFESGSSLIEEFNIKNTTMQARLDKSKKDLSLITRELGENLSPAMLVSTNGVTYFIKALVSAIRIFNEYKGTIIGAAAGIAAYTIAIKVAAGWDSIHYGYLVTKTAITKAYTWVVRLLTGEVTLATAAQNAWNIAQKANPIGIVIGLITAAATAYLIFRNKLKEANVEQKKFNDELERGKELMGQTKSIEERARVMKTMNDRQLEEFKGTLDDQIKAEEDFHAKLLTEAQKAMDADAELQELYRNRNANGLSEMQKILLNSQINFRKKMLVNDLQDQDNESQKRLALLRKYRDEANKINKDDDGSGGSPNAAVSDAIDIAHAKGILRIKQYYADKENLDKESKARLLAAELAFLMAKEKLETDELKKLELQSQVIDKQQEYKKALQEALPEMLKSRDEINKTNKARLEEGKLLTSAAKKEADVETATEALTKKTEAHRDMILDTSDALSQSIYDLASGGEDALREAGKNILLFALDMLKKQTEIAIAGATIQSLTQPDSIATFGASGLVRASIIVGLIEAAFAGVKGLVNNAFTKKTDNYYDGGYTPGGAWNEPKGVVHSEEFVANRFATRNPEVKQFLDVFDYYQRTGQISRLNTRMILANLPVQKMYVGGYSSSNPAGTQNNNIPSFFPAGGSNIDSVTMKELVLTLKELKGWKPVLSVEEYEKKRNNWSKITSGGLK